MIAAILTFYAAFGLLLVVALAFAASVSAPRENRETKLLQLMLRTELKSKPAVWHTKKLRVAITNASRISAGRFQLASHDFRPNKRAG